MIKGYCWGRESFCRAVWKACACYLSQTQGFCWGLAFVCSFPPTPMFLQHPAEAMVSSCSEPLENPTTLAPWKLPPLWLHLWGELQPSAGGLHCPGSPCTPCTAGGSACRSCCPKGWPEKRLIHPRGCPGGSPGTLRGSAGLSAPRACIWRAEGG